MSIDFNMQAAGLAQLGSSGRPINPVLPADIGQRGLGTLFEPPQPTDIDVGFILPKTLGNLDGPPPQAILDILFFAAPAARVHEFAVQLRLNVALERTEEGKLIPPSAPIEKIK